MPAALAGQFGVLPLLPLEMTISKISRFRMSENSCNLHWQLTHIHYDYTSNKKKTWSRGPVLCAATIPFVNKASMVYHFGNTPSRTDKNPFKI